MNAPYLMRCSIYGCTCKFSIELANVDIELEGHSVQVRIFLCRKHRKEVGL